MDIAFYAPMKAPDHPVPSGDRRMAQLLLRALRLAGHRVSVASRLRSYDGTGDAARQGRLGAVAGRLARRYVERRGESPPDLWFTYHCYHKAPDLLGPAVADAFGIPFVIADASVAPKQATGPWAGGYAAANAAIRRADRLIAFDPLDLPCLRTLRNGTAGIVQMAPFADLAPPAADDRAAARQRLARDLAIDPAMPWLAVTAMMRPGAKRDFIRCSPGRSRASRAGNGCCSWLATDRRGRRSKRRSAISRQSASSGSSTGTRCTACIWQAISRSGPRSTKAIAWRWSRGSPPGFPLSLAIGRASPGSSGTARPVC